MCFLFNCSSGMMGRGHGSYVELISDRCSLDFKSHACCTCMPPKLALTRVRSASRFCSPELESAQDAEIIRHRRRQRKRRYREQRFPAKLNATFTRDDGRYDGSRLSYCRSRHNCCSTKSRSQGMQPGVWRACLRFGEHPFKGHQNTCSTWFVVIFSAHRCSCHIFSRYAVPHKTIYVPEATLNSKRMFLWHVR